MKNNNYTSVKSEMFLSLTSNNGMQHLVDTAAKVIGNPVSIEIIDENVKYSSADMPKDIKIAGTSVFKKLYDQGVLVSYDSTMKAHEPIYLPHKIDSYEYIIAPLRINTGTVGYLNVVLNNHPFKEDDIELIKILQDVFQLTLKTDMGGALLIKRDNIAKLLHSLFGGERTSLSRFALWEELGLNKDNPLQIFIAIYPQHYGASTPAMTIREQLSDVLDSNLYILKNEQVIFLCNSNLKEKKNKISSVLDRLGLVAGVSYIFYSLEEIKERYQQAIEAIHLGTFRNNSTLYFYEEHILYKVTERQLLQGKIQEYCHPSVYNIYRYDKKNSTSLLKTLQIYFSCGRNLEATAKQLDIHRNTIIQRLDKINELTQSYCFSANSLYNVYLSTLLIDFYSI